jgi:hypothetical protein
VKRGVAATLAAALAVALWAVVPASATSPQEGGVSGSQANKVGLASGDVNGWTTNRKFGSNGAVGTTLEPIWDLSIGTLPFLEAAGTLSISSGDNDDIAGGTGCRTLTIQGLDADFVLLSETVAMDGGTVVVSAGSYSRVFRAFVEDVGTHGGANEGLITITASTDTRTMATVPAGEGQTQQAIFTTSSTQTAYVTRMTIGVESAKTVSIHLLTRANADDVAAPVKGVRHQMHLLGVGAGVHSVTFDAPIVVGPKTDIWLSAEVALTSAAISGEYSMTIADTAAP